MMGCPESEAYLRPCGLIDMDHPSIQGKVRELTNGLDSDVEKALAIYTFVKDEIKFGFSPEFGELVLLPLDSSGCLLA